MVTSQITKERGFTAYTYTNVFSLFRLLLKVTPYSPIEGMHQQGLGYTVLKVKHPSGRTLKGWA